MTVKSQWNPDVGVTPAFHVLVRGQPRARLLVQTEKSVDIQVYLRARLAVSTVLKSMRVVEDVDRVSFLKRSC